MTESDAPTWADLGYTPDDDDRHVVDPETYAKVYPQPDGSVVFDEGWQQAWIESDTVVEVRR